MPIEKTSSFRKEANMSYLIILLWICLVCIAIGFLVEFLDGIICIRCIVENIEITQKENGYFEDWQLFSTHIRVTLVKNDGQKILIDQTAEEKTINYHAIFIKGEEVLYYPISGRFKKPN